MLGKPGKTEQMCFGTSLEVAYGLLTPEKQ